MSFGPRNIEDYLIIEKKATELEQMVGNYHKQIKLHEENEVKRKQQLESLILINNRITLDNAALKKELDAFKSHKKELLEDFNRLKEFYQELGVKYDRLRQENDILHSEIAKHRITLDRQSKEVDALKNDQKEWAERNSELEFTIKTLKHNSKKLELNLLEQTINDRTQIMYDKSADNQIYNNQQELRERIQLLESAVQKHNKSVSSTSKGLSQTTKNEYNKMLQKFKKYFGETRQKIIKIVMQQPQNNSYVKQIKMILIEIVSFLQKQAKP